MKKYIFFLLFNLLAVSVVAHELQPGLLQIRQLGVESWDFMLKVPVKNQSTRMNLHVQLPSDCEIITPLVSTFTGTAFIDRFSIKRAGGLAGAEISIDGLEATRTDVLVRLERNDNNTQTTRLTPTSTSFIVQSTPTTAQVIKTYTLLGIEHIWKGIDHLLFVACLIFITGFSRKLFLTITGFTLAHSITLILAALDVIRLPIPPVEACIALSVVFLASEIARGSKDSLSFRYPFLVSSLFGLLHGFGFAAVLNEIGLPQTDFIVGLLFFNAGVEVGQILFVAAILACGYISITIFRNLFKSNQDSNKILLKLQTPTAYFIGVIAMYWVFERMSGF